VDEARCVPGSFRKESLLEDPPASTNSEGGSAGSSGSGDGNGNGGGRANAAVSVAVHVMCAFTGLFAFVVGAALF
jgi:hypothetical protein